MRAELDQRLSLALEAIAATRAECVCSVLGPPGSGKTTALAARAVRLAEGGSALVICSHESGARAFRAVLLALGNSGDVRVDTAPGHCLRWLRTHYALAGVRPDVRAGGEIAADAIVRVAAAGLLDMSWPELRDLDLNMPFLSRPDAFLEEAAILFRLLRGARVTAEEFESASAAGIVAFYGDEVEAALAKCRDPDVRSRVSKRGREALGVGPAVLQAQRRAERDLDVVLGRLYREYLRAARIAPLLSDEDIVDETLRWLAADGKSARAIASEYAAVIVDDAEDAHPGVAELLLGFVACGVRSVTIAGWPDAAIDGLRGRRSALDALTADERFVLPPLALPVATAARFSGEAEEVSHVAAAIAVLLRSGIGAADIAVLTRSADAAAVYADLLTDAGLPMDAPLDRFAAPKVIADWLALAAVVDDPYDHAHMLRVLASPLLGLADASIFALCEDPAAVTQLALEVGVNDERKRAGAKRQHTALARNMLEGNADARLPADTRALIVKFRETLASWRTSLAGLAPPVALARLADVGGFTAHWSSAPQHRQARLLEDAQRVLEAVVADGASGEQRSLFELVDAFESGALPVRPATRSNLVIVCDTISGAKGERWPHVFVVGLAHERFPRIYVSRAMAFSRTYGLVVRENVAPGAAQTAKFAWYYARFDAKALYFAEEARALRYGLSRGALSASASGFGAAPRWAKEADLLAGLSKS